jgi:16S rRNA (adenine(1408)-N(1))-methyltransferase
LEVHAVKGNKIIEISRKEFETLKAAYSEVVVDLGTGDGNFVYKNAVENHESLFIGVDPAEKQMEEFSKKTLRKKLPNALFVQGSLEMLPEELLNSANKLYITLPWGSLLSAVASPTANSILAIKNILAANAAVEIIFGYDPELEPSESLRLGLAKIDENYIRKEITPVFAQNGFQPESLACLKARDLKNLNSTWGKKISSRPTRPLFRLKLRLTLS